MKRILIAVLMGITTASWAGVITRPNTYTAGDTIRSADVNLNETTIYNEFNGNIESANILNGTIATVDIADDAVTEAKLDNTLVSSFTYIPTIGVYKRPVLKYISATSIDVENNTGTSNETCIMFKSGTRCVTEDTSSTNKYRRFIITSAAQYTSGTEDSGLVGAVEAGNTWYALYAVKSQINPENFVIAGSTRTPSQANYSALNSMFGTDSWIYLGLIRNGADGATSTTDLLDFDMAGNVTLFGNTNNGGSPGIATTGIRFADTGGATSLSYTYTTGTGNAEVPANIVFVQWNGQIAGVASTHIMDDTSGVRAYFTQTSNSNAQLMVEWVGAGESIRLRAGNGASLAMDLIMSGFVDGALGVGYNPLF